MTTLSSPYTHFPTITFMVLHAQSDSGLEQHTEVNGKITLSGN